MDIFHFFLRFFNFFHRFSSSSPSRFKQFNPTDFPGGSLDQLVQHLGIGKLKQQKEW